MSEQVKWCWDCHCLDIARGWAGSEVTPGDPPSFGCYKGHWEYNPYKDDRLSLKRKMTTATTCTDYHKDEDG